MKKLRFVCMVMIGMTASIAFVARAQEGSPRSAFNVGADLFTSYVWRGTQLGSGPSLQPSVQYVLGGLTAGVWGAFDVNGYAEADPYISYEFPFGLTVGLTDYYYPGMPLFEISDTAGSHALEINAGFSKWGLTLGANYIVNEAGGAASAGGDSYFQAEYAFRHFSIFLGAGDGWHTSDGDFAVCNVGIGTTKEIRITESFAIPVNGQVIVNPEREQLYLVVGFSF